MGTTHFKSNIAVASAYDVYGDRENIQILFSLAADGDVCAFVPTKRVSIEKAYILSPLAVASHGTNKWMLGLKNYGLAGGSAYNVASGKTTAGYPITANQPWALGTPNAATKVLTAYSALALIGSVGGAPNSFSNALLVIEYFKLEP